MRAAMVPSSVTGEEGTKGGLWCSPVPKKSRPSCSAATAISIVFLMRSCSLGPRPVAGSATMSPTVKMPKCIRLRGAGAWGVGALEAGAWAGEAGAWLPAAVVAGAAPGVVCALLMALSFRGSHACA